MKKALLVIAVLGVFASCKNSESETTSHGAVVQPGKVEGEIVALATNTTIKLPENEISYTVTITTKSKTYDLPVTKEILDECQKKVSPTSSSHLFARMERTQSGLYSVNEFAQLNYDKGTPPVYEFPSDKKVAGYYTEKG